MISWTGSAQVEKPLKDVKYDTRHERNVLDFWPALDQGEKPGPILVWFHGGGFKNGDKSQLVKNRKIMLDTYRKQGYAVASCNYPFLSDDMDHREIAGHCARAIQFLRSKSEEWHFDPERLACGGVSAGALISEFLGYHDDLAEPEAEDHVKRESSRAAVVLSVMQPIGTREFALNFMDKGEAPIFLYSNAAPTDRIHPPNTTLMIQEKARKLDIPCAVYGGGRNKLPKVPDNTNWLTLQIEFCSKYLNQE